MGANVHILFLKALGTGASRKLLIARIALPEPLSSPYHIKPCTATGLQTPTTVKWVRVPAGMLAHPPWRRHYCAAGGGQHSAMLINSAKNLRH
jgi:hypothetical protein